MNMYRAIALSAGNKATTHNDQGKLIVVQKCIAYDFEKYFSTPTNRQGGVFIHYYIWLFGRTEDGGQTIEEVTLENYQSGDILKQKYFVDPEANYWQSV